MKKIPKMVKENLLKNLIIDWVDLMYDCMMYSLLLSLLNGVHKIAETAVLCQTILEGHLPLRPIKDFTNFRQVISPLLLSQKLLYTVLYTINSFGQKHYSMFCKALKNALTCLYCMRLHS